MRDIVVGSIELFQKEADIIVQAQIEVYTIIAMNAMEAFRHATSKERL
jgi:hypothetical protein